MKPTGQRLTAEEYAEVTSLIQQTMQIDLARGQNIYETDKRAAMSRLQEIAVRKGLPALEGGKTWGLSASRELVAPD